MNLRRATKKSEDLKTLIAIEESVAGSEIYSAMTTEEEWTKELTKSTVYIIENNGVAVGNIEYEMQGKDFACLCGFAIVPDFQGQGIGGEALAKVLDELKNVSRIELATHPKNSRAIMLYLSYGFSIESWKDNYYGDGEPRIIMSKTNK